MKLESYNSDALGRFSRKAQTASEVYMETLVNPIENKESVDENDTGLMDFLDRYLEAYALRRDPDAVAALFHSEATLVGTGVGEVAQTLHEVVRLYRKDCEQAPHPMHVVRHLVRAREIGPGAGVISGVFAFGVQTVAGPADFEELRLTFALVRDRAGWKIFHHHISVPSFHQKPGEGYPLEELRRQNERLAREVALQTEAVEVRNRELQQANDRLERALGEVVTLRGLIPMCAGCKRIRSDQGFWHEVAEYLQKMGGIQVTHGLCPECARSLYPELFPETRDGFSKLQARLQKTAGESKT